MSKYTRSNKINHYHDNNTNRRIRLFITNNNNNTKLARSIKTRIGTTSINNHNDRMSLRSYHRSNSINNNFSSKQLANYSKLSKQLTLYAFFILFVLMISNQMNEVESLNCYHCSSVDNPECDESFTGKGNITDTDCEKHIGRPAKVCRKIVQYIEHKKVVIRSCGFIDEHEEKDRKTMCYKRSGTFAIMMESCNCYEDNCNHSASLVPSRSLLTLLPATLLPLFYYYFHNHSNKVIYGHQKY